MWVPGSLVYVAVALVLLARWINAGNSPTNPATAVFPPSLLNGDAAGTTSPL